MKQREMLKIAAVFFALILIFSASNTLVPLRPAGALSSSQSSFRGGCRTAWCLSEKDDFHFAVVADLDRQSKISDSKWKSVFKRATLRLTEADSWVINWHEEVELTTKLGEAGRGLELSELVTWQGKLWTFDDRSGVVFELDEAHQCIPRYILMEGDGANSKGQKTEWATEKDGKLYVGSFGKPYTNNAGEVTSRNNLWISIIDPSGAVTHEDWTQKYAFMQQMTDSVFPGYMIHEAIHWDDINRLWYVLPRRVSHERYDEKLDEEMGSNLLMVFNEDFSKLEKKLEIGEHIKTHGWSSLKFLPWTNNQVIIALRTVEVEDKATGDSSQETYLTIFNVNGEIHLKEQRIPGDVKFEGIEFL
eukprot:CAMPEP_0184528694 /NCGR_PEP_ID=MMETSP0198_2-20121128/11932_1 /TAXON_ID=1112570 /ORGANISM="Thraustochytrium sp., Strain LLF1b" /LENGTH=360 /DNA_ID=CAMNT_0026920565 /DNA_START=328 /DNA_END=1410 /DNA_ORIENTATION=-